MKWVEWARRVAPAQIVLDRKVDWLIIRFIGEKKTAVFE